MAVQSTQVTRHPSPGLPASASGSIYTHNTPNSSTAGTVVSGGSGYVDVEMLGATYSAAAFRGRYVVVWEISLFSRMTGADVRVCVWVGGWGVEGACLNSYRPVKHYRRAIMKWTNMIVLCRHSRLDLQPMKVPMKDVGCCLRLRPRGQDPTVQVETVAAGWDGSGRGIRDAR